MRVRFNKEKFHSEVVNKMKPTTSWWALVGNVMFFFLPEIIIFFWGDELKSYLLSMQYLVQDATLKSWYIKLTNISSENSILNILVGVLLTIWFFHERKKSLHEASKYKDLL